MRSIALDNKQGVSCISALLTTKFFEAIRSNDLQRIQQVIEEIVPAESSSQSEKITKQKYLQQLSIQDPRLLSGQNNGRVSSVLNNGKNKVNRSCLFSLSLSFS
jgi:hypothetical protein